MRPLRWPRWPAAICGLLFLLPCHGIAANAPDTPPIPVMRIDARQLSALELGLRTGQEAKQLFPDIKQRYDAVLAKLFTQTSFDALREERLPGLLQGLAPQYRDELKGVAAAWTLDRENRLGDGKLSNDEYHLLNLLADMGQSPGGSGFGLMAKLSAEGSSMVGRNLDWNIPPEALGLQAITVQEYSGRALVNIGFAGLLPVLAGFNDQGVFATVLNAEPASPYPQFGGNAQNISSLGFAARAALETSSSARQASRFLAEQQFGSSQNIFLADRKRVEVVEFPANGMGKIRTWKSPLHSDKAWGKRREIAVVGCNLLAELPYNCTDSKDTVRWERLRELATFSPQHLASVADMGAILGDTINDGFEIFNRRTAQSMIYLPENSSLYLYAASPNAPPALAPLHKAYLELVPTPLRHRQAFDPLQILVWLVWLFLAVKLVVVAWLFRKPMGDFIKRHTPPS